MDANAQSQRRTDYVVLLGLLVQTLILSVSLGSISSDDPFVTYRYARNLHLGRGFVYNPGEAVLSTTAPFYAFVLAAGARLNEDLPALSNGLSIAALFVGGYCLYLLCRDHLHKVAGILAAALFICSPLLWLSLGFETCFYLALLIGAFYFYSRRGEVIPGTLLGLALTTRGDGILPAVVLFVHYLATHKRLPWRALAAYLIVSVPFVVYLTRQFGSPLPVTLAAKSAQTTLGVTGFYPHTTFAEGAWILVRAYLSQSKLYLLVAACAGVGLVTAAKHAQWLWPMNVWTALYFCAYVALGVAPYQWYYAPLVPAIVVLPALGMEVILRRLESMLATRSVRPTQPEVPAMLTPRWRAGVAVALGLLLLAPQLVSLAEMHRALREPGQVPPESPVYKVLPEAKVRVYRQVGEWLSQNTPLDAVVGVTEVGVIGYYADRTMVDFLGLLRPDVARALASGNMPWALLYYQPDYVVLTRVNPLYSYDLRADQWFQQAYLPVRVFEDERFWGGPVTVYGRKTPPRKPLEDAGVPPDALPLGIVFGNKVELLAYQVDLSRNPEVLRPGDVLEVTLYWQCLMPMQSDYVVFVHLLGDHELVIAQRDAAPCLGACPTRGWKPGQIFADAHMIALPTTAYSPDRAKLEVGLYEPQSQQRLQAATTEGRSLGDNARFHQFRIEPSVESPLPNPMQMNFDNQIILAGYDLDSRIVAPGQTIGLTLYWQARQDVSHNYSVFTHLLSEEGERVAQMDSWPQKGQAPTSGWRAGTLVDDRYELAVPADTPPGVYRIHVGLYSSETLQRLRLLDMGGQPYADHVALCPIRVVTEHE